MTAGERLDRAVADVVRNGNCSGCGMCTLLDSGLEMQLDEHGFNRPVRTAASTAGPNAASRFDVACPGRLVRAQAPPGSVRHPTMGPVIAAWRAWATDADVRYTGSSGGVITALVAWLTESGESAFAIGAAAAPADPRRTVSVRITSREEALAAAGSRYAPASNCSAAGSTDASGAFVGKPCEVSALRALTSPRETAPLLISFFCAGTPSQHATTALTERLGVGRTEPVEALWYRGHGWPGRFTVVPQRGKSVDASYEESWGRHLGPAVQWRCKICPDGVGESADITAADLWNADSRGYPVFTEAAGTSALIARTTRGYDTIIRAITAGVIEARPIDVAELAAVQPLQRDRRQTLLGRLAGTRAAGGKVPRYAGFGLTRLALARFREVLRVARGAYRRRRAWGGPT
jgi:coenzyme F420 hydrogenase subunit beta